MRILALRCIPFRSVCRLVGLASALIVLPATASALDSEQVALVVNERAPAGQRLAEYYAKRRNIPDSRIISIAMPDADEMSADQYAKQVVPAVRRFLKDHALESKITCLVTFQGVPLRVGPRVQTAAEREEFGVLGQEFDHALTAVKAAIASVEGVARSVDPAFQPITAAEDLPSLQARADAAVQATLRNLEEMTDPLKRVTPFTELLNAIELLYGPLETIQRLGQAPYSTYAPHPLSPEKVEAAQKRLQSDLAEMERLAAQPEDADSRTKMRKAIRDDFGQLRYVTLISQQRAQLDPSESHAAFDSELALLWWPDSYPRHRWIDNPLYYRVRYSNQRPKTPAVMMVMRLDGPSEQKVHDLIDTTLRIEAEGLTGDVALDARGKPVSDAYGQYDQTIRNLAELLRAKTRLHVTLDDAEPVFLKGSVKDVALYCGWYSVHHYVPGMVFKPGAVGFHIASFELTTLRDPNDTGWVRGLINDGVVATLGPVAEPYLHSFPRADEFFPLLLTGRHTLAEVYWETTPLVSWMQCFIGDPLYRPYAVNPPLKTEDVPPRLHVIFERGASLLPVEPTGP